MFGFLGKVAHGVGDIANKMKQEVNDFLAENKKLEDNAKLDDKSLNDVF